MVETPIFTGQSASSGTKAPAPTATGVGGSMFVGLASSQGKQGRDINPPHMATPPEANQMISGPSDSSESRFNGDIKWSTEDFVEAHNKVVSSRKFNHESCMIPIPTSIRYDRLEQALGPNITPKEQLFIKLLKFGMPINCKYGFGVSKLKKNHHSALAHKDAISKYISENVKSQAMLGPFDAPPNNEP